MPRRVDEDEYDSNEDIWDEDIVEDDDDVVSDEPKEDDMSISDTSVEL